MRGPEAKIEDAIVTWACRQGGAALKLKIEGQRGFPDRTLLMPGGVALFLEVKKPAGGIVSQQQTVWAERLCGLGFVVEVVRSLGEAQEAYALAIKLKSIAP